MEKIRARGVVFHDWGGMSMDEGEKRLKPVEVDERREGENARATGLLQKENNRKQQKTNTL